MEVDEHRDAIVECESESRIETFRESTDYNNVPIDIEGVNIIESPKFNVKINKTMITMVLDTGATGSMISLDMCELANLRVYPSNHSAIQADGDSQLQVVSEVHTSILLDNFLTLPINAVVVTRLKAGLIVGMAFMKRHGIVIDISNNSLNLIRRSIQRSERITTNPVKYGHQCVWELIYRHQKREKFLVIVQKI